MNPFTPKTDHNLNSSHKINTPTNMVSIRIRENLNWRTVFFTRNVMLHRILGIRNNEKHILISWENISSELGSS